jgi:hypothetical protein
MDREKRMIIVNEIEHWQRSKLLPDHYCDFLLNLYRDPEVTRTVAEQERKKAIINSHPLHWLLLFGATALICYVGLHFIAFHPLLQIGVFLAAVIGAHGASAYFRNRKPLLSYALFGIGAFVLLVGGALLLKANGSEDWGSVTVYVACCSVLWVAFGLVLRVPWIQLCGWSGLMLAYGVLLNRSLQPETWLLLELSWIPLAVLYGWGGWLLGKRAKQASAVFLIVSCLLWFAPEAYALAFTDLSRTVTQAAMLGKMVILGGLAFGLRKLWTEWVV